MESGTVGVLRDIEPGSCDALGLGITSSVLAHVGTSRTYNRRVSTVTSILNVGGTFVAIIAQLRVIPATQI